MNHPFLDFLILIGTNPRALRAFVADPIGDPDAVHLTDLQKTVLANTTVPAGKKIDEIHALLKAENPAVESLLDGPAGAVQAIGWNMSALMDQISAAKKAQA